MRELNAEDVQRMTDPRSLEERWAEPDAYAGAEAEAIPPLTRDDPESWWENLVFDEAGSKIEYQGTEWRPKELASAGEALARYAAASLKGRTSAADVNNRACCLCYADHENLERPKALLEGLGDKATATSKANLKVITDRAAAAGAAGGGG